MRRDKANGLVTASVAVIVPCFNEAATIGGVVGAFRSSLPSCNVFVFDNNSTDETRKVAAEAGAIVASEARQGKGNVVRRMFADVDADIYVLVDGDGTYDPESAPRMVQVLWAGGYDMVAGVRKPTERAAYRRGHRAGNRILTTIVSSVFGRPIRDLLTGYRVLSRRFVKSFPALSSGFEIETELSVHALELGIPFAEIDTPYFARPEGSESKLSTFRDGWRILITIVKLMKGERPLAFFGGIGAVLALLSLGIGVSLWIEFVETGLVPRFPSAVLATGLMLTAALSLVCGLVLDTVTRGRQEMKRLAYLALPSLRASAMPTPLSSDRQL